jgi:pimeloyl-ACP methyl ester carboxylesterase
VNAWTRLEQTINGQRWRYVDTQPDGDKPDGDKPDGDKPIVLLLHGFTLGSSLLTYAPLVASLQPDYRVIVPDLPGFGGSDALKTATPDSNAYASALATFVEILALKSFYMVAFSMGGAVTLRYLNAHLSDKTRLQGLILSSSYGLRRLPYPPLLLPLGLRGRLAERLANRLLTSPTRVKWLMRYMVLSQNVDSRLVHEVLEHRLELPPAFMAWLRSEVGWLAHRHHDANVLAELACPVHLVHGSRDMVVPVWDSQRAAKRYNLPVTVVPKAGHWLPRQVPEVLEACLRQLE